MRTSTPMSGANVNSAMVDPWPSPWRPGPSHSSRQNLHSKMKQSSLRWRSDMLSELMMSSDEESEVPYQSIPRNEDDADTLELAIHNKRERNDAIKILKKTKNSGGNNIPVAEESDEAPMNPQPMQPIRMINKTKHTLQLSDISPSEEEEFSRTNIESSLVRRNIYEDKGRGRQTLNKNQKVVHAQVHSENTDEDESHVTANEDDNKRDGSPPVSEYGKGSFEGNIKMEKGKNKKTLVENSTKSNKRTAINAVRKKKPTSEYESDDTSNKGDESPPLSEHGKGNSRMANERNKNTPVKHSTKSYKSAAPNKGEKRTPISENEPDDTSNKGDESPPLSEHGKGNSRMANERNKNTPVKHSTKSYKSAAPNKGEKRTPISENEPDDTSNKGDESPPLSEHGKGNSRMANERNKNTPVKHSTKSYKSAAPNKGEKRTPISENEPDVRRSKRNRVRRLEYWRGETIEYKLGMDNCLEVVGIIPGSPDYICSPLLQKGPIPRSGSETMEDYDSVTEKQKKMSPKKIPQMSVKSRRENAADNEIDDTSNKGDESPPLSEHGKGNSRMANERNKNTPVKHSTKSYKSAAPNKGEKRTPISENEPDDTSNKGDESPPLSEHGKGNSRMANERNKNTPVKHSTKSYKSAAPNKGEKRTPISENEPDVRRSKRNRVRRLEYWRGETIEYKLGMDNCLEVVGIIPGSPDYICSPLLQKAKRKDNITALVDKDEGSRRKSIALSHGNNVIMHGPIPRSGSETMEDYDSVTEKQKKMSPKKIPQMSVKSRRENAADNEIECFSTFRIDPETAESDVTVLNGLEVPSMSAGLIKVAPFAVKRDLVNDESSLVSFILNGSVTVQILRTTRTLKKGEIFFVPRGVHYSIANKSPKTAVITYMMYE
ncbi:uncharacterized protein [Periplaneta americana]|uniref:uncharacterized protein isoform X2 n=1 Tax=Periplaneta americana TaxID=6978 RepID=UPI0037E91EFD